MTIQGPRDPWVSDEHESDQRAMYWALAGAAGKGQQPAPSDTHQARADIYEGFVRALPEKEMAEFCREWNDQSAAISRAIGPFNMKGGTESIAPVNSNPGVSHFIDGTPTIPTDWEACLAPPANAGLQSSAGPSPAPFNSAADLTRWVIQQYKAQHVHPSMEDWAALPIHGGWLRSANTGMHKAVDDDCAAMFVNAEPKIDEKLRIKLPSGVNSVIIKAIRAGDRYNSPIESAIVSRALGSGACVSLSLNSDEIAALEQVIRTATQRINKSYLETRDGPFNG